MDFADFDLAAVAEKGTWLHLWLNWEKVYTTFDEDGNPIKSGPFEFRGSPLYRQSDDTIGADKTDKPCRVLLKGVNSDATMDCLKKIGRISDKAKWKKKRSPESEHDAIDDQLEKDIKPMFGQLIETSVSKWENIMIGGKESTCDKANKLKICGPGSVFFEQTQTKILERHDFLKDAAKKS